MVPVFCCAHNNGYVKPEGSPATSDSNTVAPYINKDKGSMAASSSKSTASNKDARSSYN